jgi:pimeloyl-ACP methyl ester carboxylesterase
MRSLIYPAPRVPVGAPPADFEEVSLRLDDGVRVVAWHRQPPAGSRHPAMVFFHGNGENLETMKAAGLYARLRQLGAPLLVVDYPGYGRSGGQPGEVALKRAADSAAAWMLQRYPERGLVPCGWSLGAALAIHVATESGIGVAGVVAISPWTRLADVANLHFPAFLVGLGLREDYDSLTQARRVEAPALVVHGVRDGIIPVTQGERIAGALRQSRWVPIAEAGHNDLLAVPRVWQEIERFLDTLVGTGAL